LNYQPTEVNFAVIRTECAERWLRQDPHRLPIRHCDISAIEL